MQLMATGRRRLAMLAVTGLAAMAALVAANGDAGAFNPQPDPPGRLSLVGVVEGQTLRLSAANVALGGPDTREGGCRVSLGFVDLEGRAVGDLEDFELRPGQGVFVDLEATAIGNANLREGGRAELRPVAQAVGHPNERTCVPAVSAQVYDSETNETEVYVTAAAAAA